MLKNSIVLFINTVFLLLGSSGILLAILLYIRDRNQLIKLYIYAISAWALNQFVITIFYYLNNIIIYNNIFINYLINDISYFFLAFFLFIITRLLYSFFNFISSKRRDFIHGIIFVLIAIPNSIPKFIIPELEKIRSIHETLKVISLYGSFYYLIYFLWSKSKSTIYKDYKKEINTAIILQLIFFPLLLIEGAGFFNQRYPFVIAISAVFFFSMNFLWLHFASKYLYLPKIRIIDNSSALERIKSIYGLSNRESQIANSIIDGKSYKEIAEELFISYETVKTHIKNIYRKCSIKSKMELAQLLKKCEN